MATQVFVLEELGNEPTSCFFTETQPNHDVIILSRFTFQSNNLMTTKVNGRLEIVCNFLRCGCWSDVLFSGTKEKCWTWQNGRVHAAGKACFQFHVLELVQKSRCLLVGDVQLNIKNHLRSELTTDSLRSIMQVSFTYWSTVNALLSRYKWGVCWGF